VLVEGGRLLRTLNKGRALWRVYSDPVVANPLKKRLYLRQVVIHESDLGLTWKRVAARDRNILERHVVASIEDRDILAYHARYNRRRGGIWRTRAPWSLLVTGAQQTLSRARSECSPRVRGECALRACGEYSPRPYPHSPSASRDRRIGGLVFMPASISIPGTTLPKAQPSSEIIITAPSSWRFITRFSTGPPWVAVCPRPLPRSVLFSIVCAATVGRISSEPPRPGFGFWLMHDGCSESAADRVGAVRRLMGCGRSPRPRLPTTARP
jgi:hypothetical protein